MRTQYISVNGTLTIPFSTGRVEIVTPAHLRYREIANALEAGAEESIVIQILNQPNTIVVSVKEDPKPEAKKDVNTEESRKDIKITFENDYIFFGNYELPTSFRDYIFRLRNSDSDFTRFNKFLNRLFSNPTKIGFSSAIDFVIRHGLTILEDGQIIAYKGVQNDHYSQHGNKETIVKRGTVDANGRILNKLNETIEVDRNQVDMDRNAGCSFGLHVGSHQYASGFSQVLMTVRLDPADICCVPNDSNFQKIRVCAYTPIQFSNESFVKAVAADIVKDEVTQETKVVAAVMEDGNERVKNKVKAYIEKKIKEDKSVKLRQVKAALPRENISTPELLELVKTLGFEVEVDNTHITNTVIR